MVGEEEIVPSEEEIITFDFLIRNPGIGIVAQMKNIPPSTLTNIHGKASEDPDTFLFEFNVLSKSYDYIIDA